MEKGPAMESLLGALMGDFLGTPVYFWVAFVAIVIGLLVFDLGILHRDEHEIGARESLTLYGFASTVVGDASSGTGTITAYQDGVTFNDGGLRTTRTIQVGRMIPDPTYGTAIQLETPDTIVMLCTPR